MTEFNPIVFSVNHCAIAREQTACGGPWGGESQEEENDRREREKTIPAVERKARTTSTAAERKQVHAGWSKKVVNISLVPASFSFRLRIVGSVVKPSWRESIPARYLIDPQLSASVPRVVHPRISAGRVYSNARSAAESTPVRARIIDLTNLRTKRAPPKHTHIHTSTLQPVAVPEPPLTNDKVNGGKP